MLASLSKKAEQDVESLNSHPLLKYYDNIILENVPDKIIVEYKPQYIKNISGVYLLVAGNDNFADLYSQATLRMVRRIEVPSRVICAVGGRNLAFVSVVSKQILIYSLKRAETWTLLR